MQQSPYLGMRLQDAEDLLKKAGLSYEIRETAPDWKKNPPEGELRVIRVDEGNDGKKPKPVLIVCRVSTTTRQL